MSGGLGYREAPSWPFESGKLTNASGRQVAGNADPNLPSLNWSGWEFKKAKWVYQDERRVWPDPIEGGKLSNNSGRQVAGNGDPDFPSLLEVEIDKDGNEDIEPSIESII